jgi:long-subunit acyl-CoA synthetase (AMP-forming)
LCFGAARAGGAFVPVNPLLKGPQVAHILRDSAASVLVTAAERLADLEPVLDDLPALEHLVVVGAAGDPIRRSGSACMVGPARDARRCTPSRDRHRRTAILYTSGSTGRPKGVVLASKHGHGRSQCREYLLNTPDDRLLAVLPFSFRLRFSQLTTAFLSVRASR